MLTTGEHEYTRYGFKQLATSGCVDILQVNGSYHTLKLPVYSTSHQDPLEQGLLVPDNLDKFLHRLVIKY